MSVVPAAGKPPSILVVDDDRRVVELLAIALGAYGFRVLQAADGEEALQLAQRERPDLVVLDVRLPRKSGYEVCERLRQDPDDPHIPIIMVSAAVETEARLQGLARGADDYVPKPFHLEEVLARIRALLRRSAGHAKSELNCGPVRLDTRTGRVAVDGNPVKLTSHEYRLLSYLMHHAGRVVSRTELVEHLYDQDFDRDSNTIEVFVGRIRKKLGVDIIQTVRGLGYLLTPPDAH